MAEIDTASENRRGKGAGVGRGKKMSTRVDLTPMVDLGFLLITFFMFTTTLTQPTSMNLKMPDDNKEAAPQYIARSGARTIWLGAKDRLYYYEGMLSEDLSNVKLSNFKDIRGVIMDKKSVTDEAHFFMILIPGNQSTYKNLVDLLDECSIDLVERYALVNKVDPAYVAYISRMDARYGGKAE